MRIGHIKVLSIIYLTYPKSLPLLIFKVKFLAYNKLNVIVRRNTTNNGIFCPIILKTIRYKAVGGLLTYIY